MRNQFDKARDRPAGTAPRQPTETVKLTTPTPAPAPTGMPTPPQRTPQDVPKIDRAAEWAKTKTGRETLAKDVPAPPARRDWSRMADPTPTSAPAPRRDWSKMTPEPTKPAPARDWSKTAEPSREINSPPERGKDRNYDQER